MTAIDNDRFFTSFKRGSDRVSISTRYSQIMAVNKCVINEGTEDELICRAYRETDVRKIFYYLIVIFTLGVAFLLFYWKPEWKAWIRGSISDIELATHLVLRDKYEQNHVKVIKTLDPIDRSYSQNHNDELKEVRNDKSSFKIPGGKISKEYIPLTSISKYGLQRTKYFEHKFNKYLWQYDTFVPLRGLDCDITIQQMQEMRNGLNGNDKADLTTLFGLNSIAIKITPIIVLLFREILNPYYAFQLFAIIVWCTDLYFSLPAVILTLSTISISLSLYLTRKQNIMIHKMSSGSGVVHVLTDDDKYKLRNSQSLLPGDVIEIQDKVETMWCDCVLLAGNCVVSESMLTGESVPVLKTPLVCSDVEGKKEHYDPSRHKQHTVYGGTKIVDVQRNQNNELPKALVIRTGFYTEKGKMIESMLAPSPMDYKFYNDSLKFIFYMAIIGFIGSLLTISFLASLGAEASFIVKRVLDLITIVVPPGLPAALTVATIYAQRRLKNADIFCISPPRIAISGKINCMCFDKTGTLTENDLKLWGVVPCKDNNNISTEAQIIPDESEPSFYDAVHNYEELPRCGRTGSECLNALASCHSLVTLDGEVTGDPVDLELFQATKWKLRKPNEIWSSDCSCVVASDDNNLTKLGIVRVFQFNSVMQRMSVVTKRNNSNQKLGVYVKGAPETIASLCNTATVPSNFEEKLQFFTMQGYRVLALAGKTLEEPHTDVQKLERNQVESKLNFFGLAVMINPLKPRTAETISTLRKADIRTVMATGDNLETALYVARKCKMIDASDKMVIVNAYEDTMTGERKISWNVDSTKTEEKNSVLQTTKSSFDMFESRMSGSYHFALTGKTLSILKEQHSSKLYYKVLACATVLARMKPDHKRHLVEGLQEMNYTVGMCGDGANDCGALKAAHSGIAIAEAETSIVAPFTSMNKDISCCVKLIREGRAALVSSFGMIKYLCIYCFVQYLSLIILYTVNSYFSDMQFLFADIGVTGIVTLFFGICGASKTLSKKQPHLSLVSPVMLTCLSLQIVLLVLFQTVSYVTLQQQTWHTKLVPNMTHPKENILSNENTVVFYTSSFQNMMLAFIFYEGMPHRLPLYKNVPYLVTFLLLSAWVLIMFFAPVSSIATFFSLTQLNYEIGFKFILLAFYVANLICAILVQKVLLQSESFRRTLKKLFGKCFSRTRKNQVKDNDTKEPITYVKLQQELRLDSSWPPLGQETVI